jgi:hypothetical protein
MYIHTNKCAILQPALLSELACKNVTCHVVWTHGKYLRVKGKGSCAKEIIHSGRIW